MYEWSSELRQSLPTKFGETNLGMVSNKNFEHREKANEIYQELMREIEKLVEEIKADLERIKNTI
jgi:hypothetical protein